MASVDDRVADVQRTGEFQLRHRQRRHLSAAVDDRPAHRQLPQHPEQSAQHASPGRLPAGEPQCKAPVVRRRIVQFPGQPHAGGIGQRHGDRPPEKLPAHGKTAQRGDHFLQRLFDFFRIQRGAAFQPRITCHQLTPHTRATLIEPPCGSNTVILESGNETLFIDSGYACYQEEMTGLFRSLLPGWDSMKKTIFITHADVDHCGLLPLFDEVYCSRRSAQSLLLEHEGKPAFREQNHLHAPYIRICKTLTAYQPVSPHRLHPLWGVEGELEQPLQPAGYFRFADLLFEVYEGKGGHLPGELVLIDYQNRVAFTGDVYVNLHNMTAEQKQYNSYAPILMTSVDTDPQLCAMERKSVFQRLGAGQWKVFGAHGAMKEYDVNA